MSDEADQDQKTEEPSQKRVEDARKRGDVPKSLEVNIWFTVLGATLVVMMFAEPMAKSLGTPLRSFLVAPHAMPVDGGSLLEMFQNLAIVMAAAIGGPLALMVVFAVGGGLVQHGLLFSAESLTPKFSRVSPLSGAKRLFSLESLLNLLKGVIKITAVGVALTLVLWPERDSLDTVVSLDLAVLLAFIHEETVLVLGTVTAILTFVAGADLLYQRQHWTAKHRMTLQEVKDEYKQQEGDPVIKGKIKQLRMERSRKRMMAAVPQASVIITNPTHYAVALRYEKGMNAPLCLAKGQDAVALKIRELAAEHRIPIVENPPLARALHATVEIDQEIPPEHYKAVAEVIGFVMRLRSRNTWRAN